MWNALRCFLAVEVRPKCERRGTHIILATSKKASRNGEWWWDCWSEIARRNNVWWRCFEWVTRTKRKWRGNENSTIWLLSIKSSRQEFIFYRRIRRKSFCALEEEVSYPMHFRLTVLRVQHTSEAEKHQIRNLFWKIAWKKIWLLPPKKKMDSGWWEHLDINDEVRKSFDLLKLVQILWSLMFQLSTITILGQLSR